MTSIAERHDRTLEPWQAPAVVRVALAGCGAVGAALLREIQTRRAALAERHGIELVLASVLVRDLHRPRAASFDRALLTNNVDAFLDTNADVVIEAIGGLDPAFQIAEATLRKGCRLVTANKALLAAHGASLVALARGSGTTVRYDAAVGGGVPILRLLDDALGAGTPTRVRGILNGTTNFVLTRLASGATLDDALAEARSAGFAEEDASRDLDGRDAADKIALVAWAAFGLAPEQAIVHRRSFLPDPARYVALAARLGRIVKQVAECAVVNNAVVSVVEPVLVEQTSALALTRDEQNLVNVDTGWSAPLSASGPGAGGLPTAIALLSDLVSTGEIPRRRGGMAAAVSDSRRSAWALEVVGAPSSLHRLVPNCGMVQTDSAARLSWCLLPNADRLEVDSILEDLTNAAAHPIATRIDCDGAAA